jgi:hypothetical protein
MKSMTPLFRIFDENKAKEFYCDFLEFKIDWEHRYEPNMPLYMQVSNGHLVLHLTEHYGDCNPGSALRVQVENIKNLHEIITAKNYKYSRPGLENNETEIRIKDPFGNQITFFESK